MAVFNYIISILILLVTLMPGCSPVISKPLTDQVDKKLTFDDVLQNPDTHKGSLVIWAGVIIGAKNRKDGTMIEVLQKPMGFEKRPKDTDNSSGRFLAIYPGFLDAEIYAKGREVTLAGEVKGREIRPMGDIQYPYPVLSVKEVYLWPKRKEEKLYPHPYWWYDPWWYYTLPPRRFR